MTLPIAKVYLILGNRDETQPEKLDDFLWRLLPYLDLTSNVYIVAPSLSEGMPQAERILKGVKAFLVDNRFVRNYLHLIHPVPRGDRNNLHHYLQNYYRPWRRGSDEFDMEAYRHQEIPRLGLLTGLAVLEEVESSFVEGLLEMLKDARLRPSLYVHGNTLSLAENKDLTGRVEKVYYGAGPSDSPVQIAQDISSQDLFERACVALHSGTLSMEAPCVASLFITAVNGLAYPCANALAEGEALANIYEELDLEALIERYQAARETKRHCKACRERIIRQFSEMPLPNGLQNEVAALLYYVGTMYQAYENPERAIEYLEKSLPLAPVGATGAICLELGTCYNSMGAYEKARGHLERAKAASPEVREIHSALGLSYFQLKDYDRAIAHLNRAVEIDPASAADYESLGANYREKGDRQKATAMFEKALALDPSMKTARENLERLRSKDGLSSI
jgi:tetratricopeptide (TPR) repeat protein